MFETKPESYLGAGVERMAAPMALDTQYTCPMHREIIRNKPG
ncbi:heavy metal-binding domain-containing protein [Manganibacter manganicus]